MRQDTDQIKEEPLLEMPLLGHLDELRTRIIRILIGIAVAFLVSLTFSNQMWKAVCAPAVDVLRHLGYPPYLVQIDPLETFNIVWIKLPAISSIFLASPWVIYQAWAFIAPGLYRAERRWTAACVVAVGWLFLLGGVFAYFLVFRYSLEFLLGMGRDISVVPAISVELYFKLFVNAIFGVGAAFEVPVLVFLLTLLRLTTPAFLLRQSRYAILLIVILAAILTPTQDIPNLALFAVPMCALYFAGVVASWLLVRHRESRLPAARRIAWSGALIIGLFGSAWLLTARYGLRPVSRWPFLVRQLP